MCDKIKLNNILLSKNKINREEILSILPELSVCIGCTQNHPAHVYDVFTHIIKVTEGLENNLILKLTGILHDIGKYYSKQVVDGVERFWGHEKVSEKMANDILNRLGYDIEIINQVCVLIRFHDIKITPEASEINSVIEKVGAELFPLLLKHQRADLFAHAPAYIERKISILEEVNRIYSNECILKL